MKIGYLRYHLVGVTKHQLKPLGRLLQELHIIRFTRWENKDWDTDRFDNEWCKS